MMHRSNQIKRKKDAYYKTLSSILRAVPNKMESVDYLTFAIDILGKELAYSNQAEMLSSGGQRLQTAINIDYQSQGSIYNLNLAPYNVVSRGYSDKKYAEAALDDYTLGHIPDKNKVTGLLLRDIGLVIITNGRHHTAVADIKGTAFAHKLDVVRLRDFNDEMMKDLFKWAYKKAVPDCEGLNDFHFQLALMLDIAKEREKLAWKNWWTIPQEIREKPDYEIAIMELENELEVLRQEIRILRHRRDQLRNHIFNAE